MAEAGYADGFDVELVTNTTERRRTEAVVVQGKSCQDRNKSRNKFNASIADV